MPKDEVIQKKLEQMHALVKELEEWVSIPFDAFVRDLVRLRASERNFQLIVDTAVDINARILIQKTETTPDTYKESFIQLGKLGVLPHSLAGTLAQSAAIRNILVHEYDFVEDYQLFYSSIKKIMPAYKDYLRIIVKTEF